MPGPGQSYSSAPQLAGCRRASQCGFFFSAKGQPLDVVTSILMKAREENVQWHPHESGNCRRSLLSLLGDTLVRVALVLCSLVAATPARVSVSARGSPPSSKPPGFWLKPPRPCHPFFFGWTSCFGTIVREPDGAGAEPCRVFVSKRLRGNLEGV